MNQEKIKVLVIEDNSDHAELIKISFEKSIDVELVFANNLKNTQIQLSTHQFDLVVADIKLPDGNSIEFFKENKFFDKNYIIVMTSFGDEQHAVNALKSGAKDYLVKDALLFSNMSNIVDRAFREIKSIKEKEEIEAELKRSEQKYRTLFESSSDGIFVMDNKKFIECNSKTLELFKFNNKEEFLGKTPMELSPINQYNGENSVSLAEKIIKEAATKKIAQQFYWKHIKSDGTPFDAEISLNPFILDNKILFHGIIKDITQKLQAEEKLKIWENIFRHAQWGIVITESTGKNINMINAALALMLGYTEAEIHFSPINKIFPKKISSIADVIIENTKNNNYYTTESVLIKKNEETFPVIINSFIIRNIKNEPLFFVFNIQNIQERKHTENLEREVEVAKRSSKLKQQFLANMSHEIRTPLNSIMGFIDLLKETELNQEQNEYLSMVDESSNILLSLINDILDFSKIEAGKLTLYPKTVNICNTFSKIHTFFEFSAKRKGLDFEIDCPTGTSLYVKIDETRLLQIISNLVSNAIKFTTQGKIKISLLLVKILKDKFLFKVEVEDTGIGISEENQEKLFNIFSQIIESNTKNIQGTGLGLAISKQLVNLMKGEIGVESIPEKGSRFWFTFWADKSEQLSVENIVKKKIDIKNLDLKLKILLAEDKVLNQKMASIMLSNAGCDVDIANNGIEVLEKFKENKYDIIFMDIHMPEMDGITAVKKLKSIYKIIPPIIGLSASAMEGDAERFIEEGLDDYLAKPVQPESLYEKLIKWSSSND